MVEEYSIFPISFESVSGHLHQEKKLDLVLKRILLLSFVNFAVVFRQAHLSLVSLYCIFEIFTSKIYVGNKIFYRQSRSVGLILFLNTVAALLDRTQKPITWVFSVFVGPITGYRDFVKMEARRLL